MSGLALLGALLVVLHHVRDDAEPAPKVGPPVTVNAGRTWFVSARSAEGGDGSAARPFAAIQPALEAAGAGDTVRVGPGTYAGGFRSVRSGSAGATIKISGYGARIVADDNSVRLVELLHDHLDLTGFEVSGGTAGIRVYGARHVRVLHNRVSDAFGECIRLKNGSSSNEVAYNQVSNCGRRNFDIAAGRKNGEGIYIGTAPEQLDEMPGDGPDRSDGNWVHDNVIDTPSECVDVKEFSSAALVEHNSCTGGRDPDGAGFSARGDRVVFRGNTVVGGEGSGIRLGGDEENQGVHATVVENRVQGSRGYGIKVMRTPQVSICGNGLDAPGMGPSNDQAVNPSAPCP